MLQVLTCTGETAGLGGCSQRDHVPSMADGTEKRVCTEQGLEQDGGVHGGCRKGGQGFRRREQPTAQLEIRGAMVVAAGIVRDGAVPAGVTLLHVTPKAAVRQDSMACMIRRC